MKHNSLGLGDIHRLANWEYATAVARLAATGFTADDIGKIAKQIDNNTFWELTAVTPAWLQVGGGSNIQVDITIGSETSNEIQVTCQIQDSSGNDIISGNYALWMFLTDDDTSLPLSSEIPDDILGNNGLEIITDLFWLGTFIDGEFIFSIQDTTSAVTYYLVIMLPDGTAFVSEAITFA